VADFSKFGNPGPVGPGNSSHCVQCEAMLSDALDGTLSAADQATFDLHMIGCPSCAALLADAERGASWMAMLKTPRPEPSATLVDRIIAETSGKAAAAAANIVLGPTDHLRTAAIPRSFAGQPAFASAKVLPFRARVTNSIRSLGQTMLQPRLAMTAAMAFFSIALTLNLTGVRLGELRASDFKPSSLMRSAYEAKAKVVRYSDNLRVVYELESRVRDLQSSSDEDRSATPQSPQKAPADRTPGGAQQPNDQNQGPGKPDQKQTKPNPGSSRRETPGSDIRMAGSVQPKAIPPFATQAFVVLTPIDLKQEGGLV
jgi:Putative zinc-finger